MADAKQIFDALIIEARSDLRSSKLLLDGTEFSRSIYHSQQAIEKVMKAGLILAGIVVTDDHWVSDRFMQSFSTMPNIMNIIRDAKYLERQATKSRYPLFRDAERPIWIPSREYTELDATDAYMKAVNIFKNITQFIKEKHNISIADT